MIFVKFFAICFKKADTNHEKRLHLCGFGGKILQLN